MRTHARARARSHTHADTHARVACTHAPRTHGTRQTHTHPPTPTRMHPYARTRAHTHTQTHRHTDTQTQTHIQTHTDTQTHTPPAGWGGFREGAALAGAGIEPSQAWPYPTSFSGLRDWIEGARAGGGGRGRLPSPRSRSLAPSIHSRSCSLLSPVNPPPSLSILS